MADHSVTRSSFLLHLSQDGPQSEVWGELYERYGNWIGGWCRKWGAAEADIEDLTQETLLRVYRHIQSYRHQGPYSFRSWIRTVARTTWLMLLRHRSRRPVLTSFPGEASIGSSNVDMVLSRSQFHRQISGEALKLEREELLEVACRRVRNRVSESSWRVFELSALAGMTAGDVAVMVGLTNSDVRNITFRLRRMLKEELELIDAQE